MAGTFELFRDGDSRYRFRLVAADGTVMAISRPFDAKPAAVAGIGEVRECAGMGLISDACGNLDQCADHPLGRPQPTLAAPLLAGDASTGRHGRVRTTFALRNPRPIRPVGAR